MQITGKFLSNINEFMTCYEFRDLLYIFCDSGKLVHLSERVRVVYIYFFLFLSIHKVNNYYKMQLLKSGKKSQVLTVVTLRN